MQNTKTGLKSVFDFKKDKGKLMDFFNYVNYGTKYLRHAVVALVFLFLGIISFYIFGYYKNYKQQVAEVALYSALDEYKNALSQQNVQLWSNVEKAFAAGYKAHSGTTLAPVFLSYQADALLNQNDIKEALNIMSKAVDLLSYDNPLYYEYAVKYAMMQIDSKDEMLSKKGLDQLEKLAGAAKNPLKDMTTYYLANYLINVDAQKAKNLLMDLASKTPENEDMLDDSNWSVLAANQLEVMR